MTRIISVMAVCFLLPLLLAGCNAGKANAEKDLQRLALIEVYSSKGELVNTLEDPDILYQFNNLNYIDSPADADLEQTEFENRTDDLSVLYTIISYKSPAALYKAEALEKLTEITVYENSNIIKEQIEPDNIKGVSISKDYLTFYFKVSEEDKNFLLSLAEFNSESFSYRCSTMK